MTALAKVIVECVHLCDAVAWLLNLLLLVFNRKKTFKK